jgi:hypothetical protein
MSEVLVIILVFAGICIWRLLQQLQEKKRETFINDFQWPPGLLTKLEQHYPGFTRKESALVGNGLRQFFLAYLKSGRRYVAMPSQCADELWHEFILYTKQYETFCQTAFGQFLHHTPAVVLHRDQKNSNEGLRRVWWQCCKIENIDPVNATRLPLLFALDRKFNIPNGFVYTPDCDRLRREGGAGGGECGAHFSSTSVDGSTSGFGDGDGGGGDSGGDGGDGGGCGGGCGGD